MKTKFREYKILIIIFIFTVCLIVINFDNERFMDVSLANIITFDIAIYVAYFLTQKKLDNRVKVEKIYSLVCSISDTARVILNIEIWENSSKNVFTLNIRKMKNKVAILESFKKKYDFEKEIEYIKNQISDLDSFVSEKIDDYEYLNKSRISIERYINNIETKCDEIFLKLYS